MTEDERRELIIEHLAEMMRTTPFTFEFKVKKKPAGIIIEHLAEMMRTTPFTFEFKVKKKPAGIKIIYEVTKEEMDNAMRQAQENR